MVTYLGSLVQLCCGEGGTLQTCHRRVWGVLAVSRPHWVCPAPGVSAFPVYTAQALGCSPRNCLRRALGCMHFPGLRRSGSGSQVLHRGADLLGWGLHFVPFPGPSCSGDQVLGKHSRPQVGAVTYRLPRPSCSVFRVYNRRGFSGVPCVSSGELISGCDPPGGCRPSRIPGSLG